MNLFPKGFFSSKNKKEDSTTNDIKTHFKGQTYRQYAQEQCLNNKGDANALELCLSHIFYCFRDEYKKDDVNQQKLKVDFNQKVAGLKLDNDHNEQNISTIEKERIGPEKEKIKKAEENIKRITENPSNSIKEKPSRVAFIIGLVIIIFLTCYLFVFYSSATYSAFFKQFSRNDIGIASSIFDSQALSNAFNDGFTELVFVLLAPFIFLGLGYLIHKFLEQNHESNFKEKVFNYIKVFVLLFVTLIFDCIIALKITQEIYNLNRGLMDPKFEYKFAIHDSNFWTIIFAGFVVYVVWGLIFSFTMDEYEKLDIVRTKIKNEEKKIKSSENEIKKYESDIETLRKQIQSNKLKIKEWESVINNGLINFKDYQPIHFEFMTGWTSCISVNNFGDEKKEAAKTISDSFIENIKTQFESTNITS